MIRLALGLLLALAPHGAALALDPESPPPFPEPETPEPPPPPQGWLTVEDPGCVSGAEAPARTEWPSEQRAVHTLTIWLNSRESVSAGPVPIDMMPPQVTAWIDVQVEPVQEGVPVATCIRPVTLELGVEPLPRGDYEWTLQRGPRPTAPTESESESGSGAAAVGG